jgi:hypothetical protein
VHSGISLSIITSTFNIQDSLHLLLYCTCKYDTRFSSQHVCEAYWSVSNVTNSLLSRCLMDWSVWSTSLAREVTGSHVPWLLLVLATLDGHGLPAEVADDRRTMQSADPYKGGKWRNFYKGNKFLILPFTCPFTCDITFLFFFSFMLHGMLEHRYFKLFVHILVLRCINHLKPSGYFTYHHV